MRRTLESAADKDGPIPAPSAEAARPRVLVVEPDDARRLRVSHGLAALGYRADAFAAVQEVPWSSPSPWIMVFTGPTVSEHELDQLRRRLDALGSERPEVRSLASVDEPSSEVSAPDGAGRPACRDGASKRPAGASEQSSLSTDESKVQLLRWIADEGPAVLRPVPCPDAVLGHAYSRLEKHCGMAAGDAIRILEDLADFGVLARRLANRVHLCPNCRRWTINFRETCPTCASLDVNIEELIHHFACAYVGLDSEYRNAGAELQCPKCRARLNHIGMDYERPRQTYACNACQALFEEPTVTAQCLDCRWEGASTRVLPWPVYEYELTQRGHEAIERGELRGLKLREMIHNDRYELASREFFELELEREMFRLRRYGRPMSVLICRFMVDDLPYALFRDADRQIARDFARLVSGQVRSLDVAALADARTIAILLPETDESQAAGALGRLRARLDEFEIKAANGQPVRRRWLSRSWNEAPDNTDEAMLWFQQQLE